MNYIGIDLGTSSVKGVLMSETFEVLFTSSSDYPIDVNNQGYAQQNPEVWYENTLKVIKELIGKSKVQVATISFSGQMHGLVILDEFDEVLYPAILWNDQRTITECQYLNEDIGKENLLKWTGNIALTGFTAPKILWLARHKPEIFKRIARIMLPKDYLVYRLCGEFVTDYSDASGTLFFDVQNRIWSKEMLEILQISTKQLPDVVESTKKIGTIYSNMKRELGIDYDISIVVGGGDQAVGAIASGSIEAEMINLSLGTSGVVYAPQKEYKCDNSGSIHNFCDATGHYLQMGVALSSGGSVEWWMRKVLNMTNFAEQEIEMRKIDVSEKLYYLPYLNGERSPINDSEIRACFIGLSLNHDQSYILRAIIEGVTFSLYQIYQSLDNNTKNQKIRVIGGGAKNQLWLEIIANVFNLEVEVIDALEGPALGAAYLGYASYNNIEVTTIAKQNVHVIATIKPNADHKAYQQKYAKWLKLYPQIRKIKL